MSKTNLEPTQPSIAIATGGAFPGIQQLGHVTDQSLSSNGNVTKERSCTSTLHTCIMHMNNLTFIILILCVHYHTDITKTGYWINSKSLAIQSTPISDLQLYIEVSSVTP
jgi:hypothetical protein